MFFSFSSSPYIERILSGVYIVRKPRSALASSYASIPQIQSKQCSFSVSGQPPSCSLLCAKANFVRGHAIQIIKEILHTKTFELSLDACNKLWKCILEGPTKAISEHGGISTGAKVLDGVRRFFFIRVMSMQLLSNHRFTRSVSSLGF